MTHDSAPASNRIDALRRDRFVLHPLLFLFPLALYSWSFGHPMVDWDDYEYIYRNGWIMNLSFENIRGVFMNHYFSNYHPLTMLSYMLDVYFWGYNATGYRIVNVVLHGMICMVSFAWLKRLGVVPWVAFFGALLFGAHPLRVESVAWVSERKDVLCGLFFMGGLYAWTRLEEGRRWLVVALVCLLLALYAKSMAVSLPVLWALHDLCLRRRYVFLHWATVAAGILMAFWFSVANIEAQSGSIKTGMPIVQRLTNATFAPLFYTMKTIAPVGLAPMYQMEVRPTLNPLWAGAGFAFCAVMLVLTIWVWRKSPILAFALLAAAICLGPVSGIVPVGAAFAADRYTYLPTIMLLPALALIRPSVRWAAPGAVVALLLLVLSSVGTIHAQSWWSSTAAIWQRVKDVYPTSTVAIVNEEIANRDDSKPIPILGPRRGLAGTAIDAESARLLRLKRYDEALAMAQKIPHRGRRAHMMRLIALDTKDTSAALAAAREVVKPANSAAIMLRVQGIITLIDNGYEEEAAKLMEALPLPSSVTHEAYGLLAFKANQAGRHEEALRYAQKGLANLAANYNAVQVATERLLADGRESEALTVLRRAASHSLADDPVKHFANLRLAELTGNVSYLDRAFDVNYYGEPKRDQHFAFAASNAERVRRFNDAADLYGRAIQSNPDNVDALFGLAVCRLREGQRARALVLLERANRLMPEDEVIRKLLEDTRSK